ncbi:hypothetical protein [Streptomyces hygroscopicus]
MSKLPHSMDLIPTQEDLTRATDACWNAHRDGSGAREPNGALST